MAWKLDDVVGYGGWTWVETVLGFAGSDELRGEDPIAVVDEEFGTFEPEILADEAVVLLVVEEVVGLVSFEEVVNAVLLLDDELIATVEPGTYGKPWPPELDSRMSMPVWEVVEDDKLVGFKEEEIAVLLLNMELAATVGSGT